MPRLMLLTTGGTIATRSGTPRLSGSDLLAEFSGSSDIADIEVEEFSQTSSSKMLPENWLELAKRINEILVVEPEIDGVVVTHGTDTLEEAAYFLNLTVKSNKSVVVVGAMRTADDLSPDGPANLANAVRLAADQASSGLGVLVTLNDDIYAARDVVKKHNSRLDAFGLTGYGWLGSVDSSGVRIHYESRLPHTVKTEFDPARYHTLPKIDLVSDFPGIDVEVIKAHVDGHPDGLVLRSFAGGRLSSQMTDSLQMISDAEIPTVIVPRVPGGRINQRASFPGIIWSNGQSEGKSRILLMLGLAETTSIGELQRIFDEY